MKKEIKEAIDPFVFYTDEEAKERLEALELKRENDFNYVEVVYDGTKFRSNEKKVIVNETNPFLNACKKAFNFMKDNAKVTLRVDDSISNVGVIRNAGCVAGPLDRMRIPNVNGKISLGPVDVSINSRDIKNIITGIAGLGGRAIF